MIVAKFGGSSLADAQRYQHAARLVLAQPAIRLAVVSASGKTTDALVALCRAAAARDRGVLMAGLARLDQHHRQIAQQLELSRTLQRQLHAELSQLRQLLVAAVEGVGDSIVNEAWRDACLGQGEQLSSVLFCGALQQCQSSELSPRDQALAAQVFDARRVICTNARFGAAQPQREVIRQRVASQLLPQLAANQVTVTQGFIGATAAGEATCLGRGGSDFSAALLAEACNALLLQIWTDVPGVASADPRLVPTARYLSACSYPFAEALARAGGKVLHPETVAPARAARIPIWVGSTLEPAAPGTWIRGGQRQDNQALALRPLTRVYRTLSQQPPLAGAEWILRTEQAYYYSLPLHGGEAGISSQNELSELSLISLLSRRPAVCAAFIALAQREDWLVGQGNHALGPAVLVPSNQAHGALRRLHQHCIEMAPVIEAVAESESRMTAPTAPASPLTQAWA